MIHGSPSAYVYHLCRCDVCKEANRVRANKIRRQKLYGRYETKFVDAAPVRAHLEELRKLGWGAHTIAKVAGIHHTQVRVLMYGRSPAEQAEGRYAKPRFPTKLLRANAEKLLAVRFSVDKSQAGVLVSAVGTHRRIQALAVIGYSLSWQAEQLGLYVSNFTGILERDTVMAKTAQAVAQMYDAYNFKPRKAENRHQQAGITRTIKMARKNKWLAPAAWDDIDADPTAPAHDGEAFIDEVLLAGIIEGRASAPWGEKRLYAAALLERGWIKGTVARLMNMAGSEVDRVASELIK